MRANLEEDISGICFFTWEQSESRRSNGKRTLKQTSYQYNFVLN